MINPNFPSIETLEGLIKQLDGRSGPLRLELPDCHFVFDTVNECRDMLETMIKMIESTEASK